MTFAGWKTVATHFVAALTGASAATATILQLTASSESKQKQVYDNNIEKGSGKYSPLSPILPITVLRPNDDLEIAFDTRTRNPVYVMERLCVTASSGKNATRMNKKFYEEKRLPPNHRSRNSFFKHSGYDRGHMAPAADFSHNVDHMKDTFNLCNISPQVPSFNRGIWSRLEKMIRDIATEEVQGRNGAAMYVITGPLWVPSSIVGKIKQKDDSSVKQTKYRFMHEAIGLPPNLVLVPTHFFKVVVVVTTNDADETKDSPNYANNNNRVEKFAAFVLPNSDKIDLIQPKDMRQILVRLSDLEAVSGMQFFSGPYLE
mmetsp:Transcript_4135/g.5309  ORF Transcript_4135/g.5309 Transcript_4135/m.5309 type:complete len:316 (-) Transcript_4135:333-1280(-)